MLRSRSWQVTLACSSCCYDPQERKATEAKLKELERRQREDKEKADKEKAEKEKAPKKRTEERPCGCTCFPTRPG